MYNLDEENKPGDVGNLNHEDGLDALLFRLSEDTARVVAVRLATAALAEVREVLGDGVGAAVVRVKDAAKLAAAGVGAGVVLVSAVEALAGGGGADEGSEDGEELHFGGLGLKRS